MMRQTALDCLILGAGAAGFSAALTLKQKGQSVAVLTKCVAGPGGAVSVCSGTWDLGPLPPWPLTEPMSLESACEWDGFRRAYRSMAIDRAEAPSSEMLLKHLRWTAESLADQLQLEVRPENAFIVPTTGGAWRRAFMLESLQARADLNELRGKRVGVVGSRQWRFPSESLAVALSESTSRHGHRPTLAPVDVELRGADWPLTQLSVRLAQDARVRDLFRDAISASLRGERFDVLLFPPLMPDAATASQLGRDLGVTIAECVGGDEPAAGRRLSVALAGTLSRNGIPLYSATPLLVDRGKSEVLVVRSGAGSNAVGGANAASEFRARTYVLATGKYLGGGIRMSWDRPREALLDLPLFASRGGGRIRHRGQLSSAGSGAERWWSTVGVKVDASFRPLGDANEVLLGNVRACGSILAGADFARLGMGLGCHSFLGAQCAKTI